MERQKNVFEIPTPENSAVTESKNSNSTCAKGPSINDVNHFFEIFDSSLPLVTHFY